MTLREYLSVPYLVVAEAVEDERGHWSRRAVHPELPDCGAETPSIEMTMAHLERRRIDVILALLRKGVRVPVPRPPLGDTDVDGLLLQHGLHAELASLLDQPATCFLRRR